MKRVLVPLDGTELATAIFPDARRIAGPDGVLILMRDASRPRYDPMTREYGEQVAIDEAMANLEPLAKDLRADGVTVEYAVPYIEDVALAIDEAARVYRADVIACATHGRRPTARLMFGGAAWRMLANSPVPVLIRHFDEKHQESGVEPLQKRRILVPLDGSELAELALPVAVKLAREWNASILLVRVVLALAPSPYASRVADVGVDMREVDMAKAYLAGVASRLPGEVDTKVLVGGIATEIVEATEKFGASDVIMATHGRTGLQRVILGSVADEVVHLSHLPIVLIPALHASQVEREEKVSVAAAQ